MCDEVNRRIERETAETVVRIGQQGRRRSCADWRGWTANATSSALEANAAGIALITLAAR